MFRNLFNHINFIAIAQHHEYDIFYHDWKELAPGVSEDGAVSVVLRCVSRYREVMFIFHAYLTPDLRILGTDGMLDPKDIFLQDQIKVTGVKPRHPDNAS